MNVSIEKNAYIINICMTNEMNVRINLNNEISLIVCQTLFKLQTFV